MTTNVDNRGLSARQDPRQVTNTMRHVVNFNDLGIASGIKIGPDALPMGAFITGVWVEIVTAFNAATTNVLTVGTNSTAYNNIVSGADVNAGATGVTSVPRGLGRSIANAADINVFATYAQTGTAATAGQVVIVIEFEGGWIG